MRASFAWLLIAVVAAAAGAAPAGAAQYYFVVDVPTSLGGADYTPSHIVRRNGATYAVQEVLPEELTLAGLLRTPEGQWLFSPAAPVWDEGGSIETRDIVLFDPADESLIFALDGSAVGVPDYAAIDALLYDRNTDQIAMSFDVPVRLDGVEYGPSDLVALGAGFSLYWSAAAAGVPLDANLVGADQDAAGDLVLAFDVPVTIGAATFFPGQLVRWRAGTGFTIYAFDAAWPASSVLGDFSFVPASGEVPDGRAGSVPLTITQAAAGQITLSWGASCAFTDTDFAVYEGTLGAPFTSHVPVTCSTHGATTWTFTPAPGNTYYYVVPRNTVSEGSYGFTSASTPRPPSTAACLPQEVGPTCG